MFDLALGHFFFQLFVVFNLRLFRSGGSHGWVVKSRLLFFAIAILIAVLYLMYLRLLILSFSSLAIYLSTSENSELSSLKFLRKVMRWGAYFSIELRMLDKILGFISFTCDVLFLTPRVLLIFLSFLRIAE